MRQIRSLVVRHAWRRAHLTFAVVQNLFDEGDSSLLSIHQPVSVFGEEDRNHIRDLVDAHLTVQTTIDPWDYYLATPSRLALTHAVYGLVPEGTQEEAVYKELVALNISIRLDRSLIEVATGQALSPIEWSGLLLLLLLLLLPLVGLIAVLPGGTVLGALVVWCAGGNPRHLHDPPAQTGSAALAREGHDLGVN